MQKVKIEVNEQGTKGAAATGKVKASVKTDFSGTEAPLPSQRAAFWTDCETPKSQALVAFDTVALAESH